MDTFKCLLCLLGGSGPFLGSLAGAQERESLAGEKAAQALKEAVQAEAQQYNMHYGPVGFQVGGGLRLGYTDNTFYSDTNRVHDFVIYPEATLAAFMQVSELNTIKLSVGLGYEYYVNNSVLNGNTPQVNPDSELAFNLFVGAFHIRFHEKFSYQQTLFINTTLSGQDILFNFNDVGIFSRWDNTAGFDVDWDLNQVILSAGYNHENFVSSTESFRYLNRASEWVTATISFLIGDQARFGVESAGNVHDYETETTLNDNWRARVGGFLEVKPLEKISFRGGGGSDRAQYDDAGKSSNFKTYYAYGRASQDTRFFTHSLSAGHESMLGNNANNLETTYVRYSISSPVVRKVDLGVNGAVHFDKEYGGAFAEKFTYYVASLNVGYQAYKHCRTELGYEYLLKDSALPFRDFYRNRVTVGVTFTF